MQFNILCTTYETIMNDRSKLSKIPWKYIIIDEAQRMKVGGVWWVCWGGGGGGGGGVAVWGVCGWGVGGGEGGRGPRGEGRIMWK
jgi:hypothetical protein